MKVSWVQYLPTSLRARLDGRTNLQKIVENTGWLVADKILRMGVGVFVGIWIARYLGPERFGLYNFALAYVALFGVFSSLGLDSIVVRNIVRQPGETEAILGTSFFLKCAGGVVGLLAATVTIGLLHPGDGLLRWLVAIVAAGMVFQAFDIVDFFFQSQVRSRYVVLARNSAFILIAMVKILLILSHAPLVAFAAAILAESILAAGGLVLAYGWKGGRILTWRWTREQAKSLLHDGWPLILSGVAIVIYMRIDQIMLGEMLGNHSVGLYSAAIRLSEVWYFIPMTITASVAPSIFEAKKKGDEPYYRKLEILFRVLSLVAFAIAVPMTFFSNVLVRVLYGSDFAASGPVLAIHIWTSIFVFLGVAQGPWTIGEGLMRLSLERTLLGAIANVLLNLLLIPRFGIVGSATATLLAQALSSFIANAFDHRTRRIFSLQVRSMAVTRTIMNLISKR